MTLRPFLLLAALVLPTFAFAADKSPAASLDFDVLTTVQYAHADIFYRTPSEFPPRLARATEIAPGQRLDLVVLAKGFAVDAEGRADLSYEFTTRYPDGKDHPAPKPVTVIAKAKLDPRTLAFPREIATFQTAPGEPSGEYVFEFTLTDHVSGAKVTNTAKIRVTDSNAPLPLPTDVDPLTFMTDYFQRPRPRLALNVLVALSHTPFAQRTPDGQGALLGFYGQLLADNPWLVPSFREHLIQTTDATERRIFALVLAYAHRDNPAFARDLPKPAVDAYTTALRLGFPRPSPAPTTGGQLDLNWGRFFASGHYDSIRDLALVVQNFLPYRGQLDAYKKQPDRPKTPPPDAMKDILLGTAMWSLGSNAHQHDLVRHYLLTLTRTPDLQPETKAALQAALNAPPPAPK